MAFLELRGVEKTYQLGEVSVAALRGVDLRIDEGEFVAIWGPSGSGKTSLLNLLGLIDVPSAGELRIAGKPLEGLTDARLSEMRSRFVGIVFQSFNLIPVLSAVENVMLPLQIRGVREKVARAKALQLLEEVGLADRADNLPDRMSGGQRQRVATARALVGDPALVLADEPTANLDSETSTRMIDLMRDLNERRHVTFVFSTHDQRLLEHVGRRVFLRDGRIAEDSRQLSRVSSPAGRS